MAAFAARNAIVSLIFCLSAIVAVASVLVFVMYSGFFAGSTEAPFQCRELLSSGSDDEFAMIFSTMAVPHILWRMFRWNSPASKIEILTFLSVGVVMLALMAMSMECGDFFFTAFRVGDRYLQIFCLFNVIAVGALIASYLADPAAKSKD